MKIILLIFIAPLLATATPDCDDVKDKLWRAHIRQHTTLADGQFPKWDDLYGRPTEARFGARYANNSSSLQQCKDGCNAGFKREVQKFINKNNVCKFRHRSNGSMVEDLSFGAITIKSHHDPRTKDCTCDAYAKINSDGEHASLQKLDPGINNDERGKIKEIIPSRKTPQTGVRRATDA